MFAEKGFHAATIRDVAAAADFSVGKLYLHFPSKSALYAELLDHFMDQVIEIYERELGGRGTPRERLEHGLHATLAFHRRNPMLVLLFVNETLGFELRMQTQLGKTFSAKYERILGCFRRLFADGIESGEYGGGSAEDLTLKYSGIVNAVFGDVVRRKRPWTEEEVAERVLRLFHEPAWRAPRRKRPS